MSSFKKISLVLVLLVALFSIGTIIFAQENLNLEDSYGEVQTNPASFGNMIIRADLVSVDFDNISRNISLKLSITNDSNLFIDGVESLVEVYKGDVLIKEGDPFNKMEFTYTFENIIGSFSPSETRIVEIKNIPPKNIDTSNYFFKISFTDKSFKNYGITHTEDPIFVTGGGGFMGGVNETYFRTVNGDNYALDGSSVKATDPAYIIIPLNEVNGKISAYTKTKTLYANVKINDAARPEKVFSVLENEQLPVVTELGQRMIKYRVKPWEGIKPGTYSINLDIINSEGIQVVDTAVYRWLIDGFLVRIDGIDSKQNFFKKGDDLNVVFSTLVFDSFSEAKDLEAQAKMILKTEDDKEYYFVKTIRLDESKTFSFSDQKIDQDILVKEITLEISNESMGIIDSLTTKLDIDNIFYPSFEFMGWLKSNRIYVNVFFTVLILLLLFLGSKINKRKYVFVLVIIMIIAWMVIIIGKGDRVNAGTSISANYDGSKLSFAISCAQCLNGVNVYARVGGVTHTFINSTGHNSSWSKIVYGSGCSAGVLVDKAANTKVCGSNSWSTDFCPPPPPPSPPVINGQCNAIAILPHAVQPVAPLCSAGTTSSVTGNTMGPWTWTCTGSNGGATATCVAPILIDLSASCSASPNPAVLIDGAVNITWSAVASNGIGSYTYFWEGSNGLTGSSATVSKIYTATGPINAKVTINSGTQTVILNCPSSASASVGGATCFDGIQNQNETGIDIGGVCGGIVIVPPTPVPGICVEDGVYSYIPSGFQLCASGNPTAVSGNGSIANPWSWICEGIYGGSNSGNCSAFKTVEIDTSGNLDCTLSIIPAASSTVAINTNTVWGVTSNCPSCQKTWSVDGIVKATNFSNTFNNIFTTIGEKIVSVQVASTTMPISGNVCQATTTVNQTGYIQEI
jgi:hypothetical protein